MRLRCAICANEQEADHLAVVCAGCGARGALAIVGTSTGLRPGEPICGPSRVPITRGRESELRGPLEEPLDVTRLRRAAYERLLSGGMIAENARRYAAEYVPVQCGRCGGDDSACAVCRGRATAPTAVLAAARAKPKRGAAKRAAR